MQFYKKCLGSRGERPTKQECKKKEKVGVKLCKDTGKRAMSRVKPNDKDLMTKVRNAINQCNS